jgi:hypothetical protein
MIRAVLYGLGLGAIGFGLCVLAVRWLIGGEK